MTTINLTEGNFSWTLENNPIVFVEFWAPWSSASQAFAVTYGAAAERHSDIVFARVDIEAEASLADVATFRPVPTLAAFRNNALVFSLPGVLNATGLEEAIQKVRDAGAEQLPAGASAHQNRNDTTLEPLILPSGFAGQNDLAPPRALTRPQAF